MADTEPPRRPGVTRRAFVGGLAAAAAAAATAHPALAVADEPPPEKKPKLSAAGEARYKAVVAKHGDQFSDEQKVDLKKQLLEVEEAGAALAAFDLEENSEPAFLFRVYRKEGRRP
jgi:hypothetical protein